MAWTVILQCAIGIAGPHPPPTEKSFAVRCGFTYCADYFNAGRVLLLGSVKNNNPVQLCWGCLQRNNYYMDWVFDFSGRREELYSQSTQQFDPGTDKQGQFLFRKIIGRNAKKIF